MGQGKPMTRRQGFLLGNSRACGILVFRCHERPASSHVTCSPKFWGRSRGRQVTSLPCGCV